MEATRVTVDEVKERMDRGEQFTFVDTRNPDAWSEGTTKISGAIRVPEHEVETHLAELSHDKTVITYCTCPHEASSAHVAEKLAEHNYRNVHPLYGGMEAWEKAGLPVEPK